MNQENLAMLERALEHLGELDQDVVFVGGATVDLWITDAAAPEFRPTEDVDVIVEVSSRRDYYRLEERLREAGFENDQESGMICRFRYPYPELVLDVMPTDASILGFSNEWLKHAYANSVKYTLPAGQAIKVIPPPFLLAAKLEAFGARGKSDFYGSRDFGDIVALIDGREELVDEVVGSPAELRRYVAGQLKDLSGHPAFPNGLEGALPPGPEAPDRVIQVIRPRVDQLIGIGAASA
ncbi:MAG TPA: nucleotidyl transferase AbiEii/AbiGii toxin family protein [Solirubrobacterales bacterium]|jgi:hypothetical protein